MKKRMLSFVLAFILIFNLSAFASAASVSPDITPNSADEVTRSAGLAWGPITVGNIEFKMTNPHSGYVGPYGYIEHTNLHIKNTDTGKDIANYHIFKAVFTDGRECMIVWDSVSYSTVFQHCDNNGWTNAVTEFVSLVSDTVSDVMSESDFLATVVIGGLLIVAIVDLIVPMDPVPVVPFSA